MMIRFTLKRVEGLKKERNILWVNVSLANKAAL